MTTEDLTPPQSPDDAIARVGDLAAAAAHLAVQPGSAVVPTGVGQAEAVKAGMVEQRAALLRQKQEVENAAAEAKALVEAKVAEMQARLAEQLELLKPALEQLELLKDGVDAMNIYLGRDEEIIPLIDGERAPAGTVISVRQYVLAMDEESMLFADKDGMDFRDIDEFADWLRRDPEHLDTLLPEQKGIVALIPRRARKHYEDPWLAIQADVANALTYWLIRNGEAAWLTTAPFTVGKHTVPTPKEFTDLFIRKGRFGEPDEKLVPGTDAWVKAERHADARTRHYMKVALLLQGLIDRTTVLHPHDGISLLEQSTYDSGKARVILDGENSLTDGRPSFKTWRTSKIEAMHPGMRVIGAFATKMRTHAGRDEAAAVRPSGATPKNMVPYNVRGSGRSFYDWEFMFERSDRIFDEKTWSYHDPKKRATGYLSNSDGWWLPLDTITEDEIAYYMGSRVHRHEYLDMIPVLKVALAVKQAEREAEEPFRTALVGVLSREADLDASEAAADELIAWFKTANQHHRALTEDDTKASRVILAEARRRARGESSDGDRVTNLRALHPGAMVVARRSSDFVVAVPEERVYPTADTNVFARLHFYTPAGKLKETREWVALTRAQVGRWTVIHKTPTWDAWKFNADPQHYYTDDELTWVIDGLRARYPHLFLVRIAPRPGVFTCASGTAYEWTDEHGLRDTSIYVKREKGSVVFSETTSRMIPTRSDSNGPHWRTRYYGESGPDKNLWLDEVIESKALAQWEAENAESKRQREARDHAISVSSRLERVWEDAAEEQVKARFVEDFGDVGLWEGHRKTIRLPEYPHRWKGDEGFRERLTDLFLLDADAEIAGLTVAEILALADERGATRRDGEGGYGRRVTYTAVDESLLHLVPVPRG